MAFTIGATGWENASGAGAGPINLGLTDTPSVGDHLIIIVRWRHATVTVSSITCTSESNPTLAITHDCTNPPGDDYNWSIYYVPNVSTSNAKTIAVTLSGSPSDNMIVYGAVYSGGDTSDFLHGTDFVDETGVDDVTFTIASVPDESLVVTAVAEWGDSGLTIPSGHTAIVMANAFDYEEGSYVLSTSADSHQWTGASSDDWGGVAAAFNVAGGAPPSGPAVGSLGLLGVGI